MLNNRKRASVARISAGRRLPDITATLRAIGARIGSADRANAAAAGIERAIAAIRSNLSGAPHPRTMLVFERDPSSLRNIYASGGYGFLHDMLEAAGGRNVFDDVKQQSVEVTTEIALARQPDVIIELWYGDSVRALDLPRRQQAWNALGSVPAVRNHRVYELVGDEFVVPGPRVVDATPKRSINAEATVGESANSALVLPVASVASALARASGWW